MPSRKRFDLCDQAEGKCIYQRIARVARLEFRLAAEVGDAEAVAVRGNATDYAFQDGVIFVDFACGARSVRPMSSCRIGPKRRESMTATGRAPMVKMSRKIPPTPVAAP